MANKIKLLVVGRRARLINIIIVDAIGRQYLLMTVFASVLTNDDNAYDCGTMRKAYTHSSRKLHERRTRKIDTLSYTLNNG
jgi:hypothetical protein